MNMEDVMRIAGHEGLPIQERWVDCAEDDGGCREEGAAAKVGSKRAYYENNDDRKSSSPEHTDLSEHQAAAATKKERFNLEPDSKASSSCKKEQDHQLQSARAQMGAAREENQRLKLYLDRIMKDYRTLQMQFYDVVQQEETKRSTDDAIDDHRQGIEESELISLRLGRCLSEPKKDAKSKGKDQTEQVKEGLSLGLDCSSFDVSKSDTNETLPNPRASPMNSFEEQKDEAGETWPPSKILKTMQSGDHDDAVQQNPPKKARVSVRARCDTPTMNDGCQWRKYGQKIAKGNPCPRAYYRCTVAPLCPVRKQVQRCPEDMSILVTTYEGTHNHPLPISATAMASTTSAAASMLLSGPNPSSNSNTIAAGLQGPNCYLSDNSKSKPFYMHNWPPLSSSSPYPTITLDLTSNPSSSSSSSSSSTHFNRYSSSYPTIRTFASTSCLNFGASNPSNAISWGNGFLSYGSTTSQSYNRNQFGKLNPSVSSSQQLVLPDDTIAAATKAITTDPSFQSAITAALNSILSTGNSTSGANPGTLKWGDQFPVANSLTSASISKGSPCATSYLNNTKSTKSQTGSSMFLPTSLPFSTTPRSASASPADQKERPH